MAEDFAELKSVLRSLVVSSATQIDVRTLLRDYRNFIGTPLPLTKYGYRDPIAFLRERFSDCFVFTGPTLNPVLTLIVPDTLKHIDKFVQKQRVSTTAKHKGKRRSVPESRFNPPTYKPPDNDLIAKTFVPTQKSTNPYRAITKNNTINEDMKNLQINSNNNYSNKENKENKINENSKQISVEQIEENVTTEIDSRDALRKFMRKRLPIFNSSDDIEKTCCEKDGMSFQDDDSGKHTGSSGGSGKALQLEELKAEILALVRAAPEGVWCTELIGLYKERYQRELNFSRFGYTSIISLVYVLAGIVITRSHESGDWLLTDEKRAPPSPKPRLPVPVPRVPAPRALASRARTSPAPDPFDSEDALPGIDFDPDVFPADCLSFNESIPSMTLEDWHAGAMLEVIVGEVYSPSHCWLIRLGDQYNIAMEDMMDDMNRYYNGEGSARWLALGAVRVGHYCSSLYDGDWHRSLIVRVQDSDTVKVRHVDYGTVDSVASSALRPLPRRWAALPAQAVRARLAAVRPAAAGRRWPHAAALHFLHLVRQRRLVANVVAVDHEENIVETLLIDTSGADDVCVCDELIRAGHADARADSALHAAEGYLWPRFAALEAALAPALADVCRYLRLGLALDYVPDYRAHVLLPAAAHELERARAQAEASRPERASPELNTMIPLLLPRDGLARDSGSSTSSCESSPDEPPRDASEAKAVVPMSRLRRRLSQTPVSTFSSKLDPDVEPFSSRLDSNVSPYSAPLNSNVAPYSSPLDPNVPPFPAPPYPASMPPGATPFPVPGHPSMPPFPGPHGGAPLFPGPHGGAPLFPAPPYPCYPALPPDPATLWFLWHALSRAAAPPGPVRPPPGFGP